MTYFSKKTISFFLLLTITLPFLLSGCVHKDQDQITLNVYNWGEYIDESVLDDFEKETGIKINYEIFTTNEDMWVKFVQGGSDYDIIIPSDYIIEKMIREDRLSPLDLSQIPNLDNLYPSFRELAFDPDYTYSIPYFWGSVGIIYDKQKVTEPVDSWSILWKDDYKGQIVMLDSQRDTLMVALKKLGYSMNSRQADELEKAKQALLDQQPLVLSYAGDNVINMMLQGEASMAVVWSGQAYMIMSESDRFAYSIPKEGTNIWFDNIVIPKQSKHKEAAHQFINYLLREDVSLKNTNYVLYDTPNRKAYDLIDPTLRQMMHDPTKIDIFKHSEIFKDPADFIETYNRIWTEVKVGQ